MKSALRLIVLIGVQILLVLLLARFVRHESLLQSGVSAEWKAVIAYGIPATFVLVACPVFVCLSLKRIVRFVAALSVASVGHWASLVVLQQTDMWFTAMYIDQMQDRLNADPRFKGVRLIGYSDDFVLFPYIPIGGSVANEDDLKALNQLLKESHPPAFAGAGPYLVRRPLGEVGVPPD
ncbi:MAG: hypothetical protein R3F13_03410 [Prosthecobacter sp.]